MKQLLLYIIILYGLKKSLGIWHILHLHDWPCNELWII